MKHTFKKSISLILALSIVLAAAFSASAVSFSETKANAFLKKFASEKAVTVRMADIQQDPLSVKDLVLSAKLNDKDKLELRASAKVKLSFLSADAYFDGKDLTAYLWIFKINATDILKDVAGFDAAMIDESSAEIAEIFKSIAELADSPVLSALSVDQKTDTVEKFSVSAVSLIAALAGAGDDQVTAALAAAGYDTKGKTDKEIKDMLVEANKAGALLPILKAAGADVTQETLDMVMEYIYDSFEFTYSGNDIKDIAVYDENGAEVFKLSKLLPFEIKAVSAGEGNVKKAPVFGIDITGIVKSIIKSIMSKISG